MQDLGLDSKECNFEEAINTFGCHTLKTTFDKCLVTQIHELTSQSESTEKNRTDWHVFVVSLTSDTDVSMYTCCTVVQNAHSWTCRVNSQYLIMQRQIFLVEDIYGTVKEDFIVLNHPSNPRDSQVPKECVVCLSAPRSVLAVPCRHLCLCPECAEVLRCAETPNAACPVCRQPFEALCEVTQVSNA